jgi:hypothetical protein
LWLNSPDLDAFPLFPPPSRHYRHLRASLKSRKAR